MNARARIDFRSTTLAIAITCLSCAIGCGPGSMTGNSPAESEGRVGFALQISPGVTLLSAGYNVSGPGGFMATGMVNIGQTSDVPVVLTGLPNGTGYNLMVSGTASDGITTCSGSAPFDVSAGMMSTVVVHLVCRQPATAGAIGITGTTNLCPIVDGLSANPASASVGGSIAIVATAHDTDTGPSPLALTWTASSGSVTGSGSAVTYGCTAPGSVTIGVVASDGDSTCNDSLSFTVNCTP
jgi:hypothetical protein